jgi:hypothetical protein
MVMSQKTFFIATTVKTNSCTVCSSCRRPDNGRSSVPLNPAVLSATPSPHPSVCTCAECCNAYVLFFVFLRYTGTCICMYVSFPHPFPIYRILLSHLISFFVLLPHPLTQNIEPTFCITNAAYRSAQPVHVFSNAWSGLSRCVHNTDDLYRLSGKCRSYKSLQKILRMCWTQLSQSKRPITRNIFIASERFCAVLRSIVQPSMHLITLHNRMFLRHKNNKISMNLLSYGHMDMTRFWVVDISVFRPISK